MFKDIFDKCSKKKRGYLSKSEYRHFIAGLELKVESDGEICYKRTKEDNNTMYNALNKVDPDVSGITKVDI